MTDIHYINTKYQNRSVKICKTFLLGNTERNFILCEERKCSFVLKVKNIRWNLSRGKTTLRNHVHSFRNHEKSREIREIKEIRRNPEKSKEIQRNQKKSREIKRNQTMKIRNQRNQ